MFFELGNVFKVLLALKKKCICQLFFDVVVKLYVYNIVNVILLVVNFLASQANKAVLFIFKSYISSRYFLISVSSNNITHYTCCHENKKRKPDVNTEFFKHFVSNFS